MSEERDAVNSKDSAADLISETNISEGVDFVKGIELEDQRSGEGSGCQKTSLKRYMRGVE